MIEKDIKYKVCTRCFTFNQASYIEDAMNGFTMQETTFPVVTLIVDDASTDSEPEVIQNYLKKHFQEPYRKEETDYAHIICAHHKTNPYCDFVVLLLKYNHYSVKKPKMPYIVEWTDNAKYHAICEGDDYWIDKNKLQKQVDFLEQNREYVLTYTNAIVVDKDSNVINQLTYKRYSGTCTKSLITEGNYIVTAGVCYRNKYDKEWSEVRTSIPFALMLGDKPLWIMLSTKGKFHFFEDYMVAYRKLEQSASHTKDYNKAMRYSDNVRDINLFFNKFYDLGISEKRIQQDSKLHRLRASYLLNWSPFLINHIKVLLNNPGLLLRKEYFKALIYSMKSKLSI